MKIKRFFSALFAISMAAACISGASSASEAKKLRVVSLAPSSTEILFALGLDEEIVGVSQYCNYPERVHYKEKVGTFSQPNIEKIISLKPDIVFCTSLEQAPAVAKLKQLGFKVCVSDPFTIDELFRSISEIGRLVGKESAADRLISEMKSVISDVAGKVASVPNQNRPKVYVEFWDSPIMTAGKGTFIDEMITYAGGVNIASNTKQAYSYFSAEDIVRQDPDVIILCYMQKKDAIGAVRGRFGWDNIAAVKNGRVYNDIDPDIVLRPGPRTADGIREMHKRFYR